MGFQYTPLPVINNGQWELKCDYCKKRIVLDPEETFPSGWRRFYIENWTGSFFACSDTCQTNIEKVRFTK